MKWSVSSSVNHSEYFEIVAVNNPQSMSQSNTEALGNRKIPYHGMTRQGFSNCGPEWWHYDSGNQFWITNAGQEPPVGITPQGCHGPASAFPKRNAFVCSCRARREAPVPPR